MLSLIRTLPSHAASEDSRTTCETAGREAEHRFNLPPGLLVAIGRAESGRRDPQTNAVTSWPWTIQAEGHGHVFTSLDAAIAATEALQRQGVTSIDVGCFQINLLHHPNAFSSLITAFDPLANADYAAKFLSRLYSRTSTWGDAVAAYHSTTPALGVAYRQRVLTNIPSISQSQISSDGFSSQVLLWQPPKDNDLVIISIPHQSGRGPSVILLPLPNTAPDKDLPLVIYQKYP